MNVARMRERAEEANAKRLGMPGPRSHAARRSVPVAVVVTTQDGSQTGNLY